MSDKKLIGILIRHGDTDTNEANQFRSRLDPPLNDKGVEQAEKLVESIHDEGLKVERIIVSPLLRSVQTGDILADYLGLEVEQDRGLISWSLGFLSGKDRDQYAEILDFFIDNPKSVPPDGECLDDLEERTFEFFNKALKSEKLTAYVSHNSNLVTVENLVKGNKDGRPESGEVGVEPGGAIGIYVDSEGKYSTDVLFGKEKPAEFGS